jgi:N-acetylmuramic acid 6-phosphate etherase
MIKLGKVYGNLMVDVKVTNQKLALRPGIVSESRVTMEQAVSLALTGQEAKPAIVMALLVSQPMRLASGLLRLTECCGR